MAADETSTMVTAFLAIGAIIAPLGIVLTLPVLLPVAVSGGLFLAICFFCSQWATQPPPTNSERPNAEKSDRYEYQRNIDITKPNKEASSNEIDEKKELHVLHGGEAAKQVADELAGQLKRYGWVLSTVLPMDSVRDMSLEDVTSPRRVVLFVVETVENGQPAESAGYAVRLFNRKRKQGITDMFNGRLEYAVLGLGDSNLLLDRQTTTAKDCNQAAQTIDSALTTLGAVRVCQRGEADDRTGLDEGVKPWIETLCHVLPSVLPPLKPVAPAINALSGGTPPTEEDTAKLTGSAAILARMRRDRVQNKKDFADSQSIEFPATAIVAYGSQTGNCKEIATSIHSECKPHQIRSTLVQLNDLTLDSLSSSQNVIDKECLRQDNAHRFVNKLKRRSANDSPLKTSLRYTLLGLGDQNYTSYMTVPRLIRRKLEELGAREFYASREVDEVEGIEEQVEPWLEKLWGALNSAVSTPQPSPESSSCQTPSVVEPYGASCELKFKDIEAPEIGDIVGVPALHEDSNILVDIDCRDAFKIDDEKKIIKERTPEQLKLDEKYLEYEWMDVVESQLMTDESSDRRVICLTLKSKSDTAELCYCPGDSIAVPPQNDPNLVKKLLQRLKCESSHLVRFQAAPAEYCVSSGDMYYTIEYLFTNLVDITSPPKKSLLRTLAEFCEDNMEKRRLLLLSSKSGAARYKRFIREGQPGLVDVLEVFLPSCKPPLEVLFAHLPRLAPRYYSIASSTHMNPKSIQIAFTVVDYVTEHGNFRKQGVATTWLQRIAPTGSLKGAHSHHSSIPVAFKSGGAFRPPPSLKPPIIMIGPGTGVSPFIGFLQERDHLYGCHKSNDDSIEIGEAWLFYGCRRHEEDFLFKLQLDTFKKSGLLTKLIVAYSRAQAKKVYVQNKMSEHRQELGRLIVDEGAYIYVCGDGAHMAKDVHAELLRILEVYGKSPMGGVYAKEFLDTLVKERKYVRDIWS